MLDTFTGYGKTCQPFFVSLSLLARQQGRQTISLYENMQVVTRRCIYAVLRACKGLHSRFAGRRTDTAGHACKGLQGAFCGIYGHCDLIFDFAGFVLQSCIFD